MALNPWSLVIHVVLILITLILFDEAGLDSGRLSVHLGANSVHVDCVHANVVQICRILVD